MSVRSFYRAVTNENLRRSFDALHKQYVVDLDHNWYSLAESKRPDLRAMARELKRRGIENLDVSPT